MQYRVLSHYHGLPAGDGLVIDCRGKIGAGDRDQRILFEKDLRPREMYFDDRFMLVVAHQEIGDLRRIDVHRSAGVNPPITETIPAQILDSVEQAGLNNGESHNV